MSARWWVAVEAAPRSASFPVVSLQEAQVVVRRIVHGGNGRMEMQEVKTVLVQIERLKEERDSYKKEAKRCQEDIDSLLSGLTKRVCFPQAELPFTPTVVDGEEAKH